MKVMTHKKMVRTETKIGNCRLFGEITNIDNLWIEFRSGNTYAKHPHVKPTGKLIAKLKLMEYTCTDNCQPIVLHTGTVTHFRVYEKIGRHHILVGIGTVGDVVMGVGNYDITVDTIYLGKGDILKIVDLTLSSEPEYVDMAWMALGD